MFVIQTYPFAVAFCFLAMLAWGSWANTQKLAEKTWRFELFYWDYALGVLLFSLVIGFTLGSSGTEGRSFVNDISQAESSNVISALLGGVVFNLSNILLVASIAIAGMSTGITIGVGIALVLGVLINYLSYPLGNPLYLFIGVGFIIAATLASAFAYRKISSGSEKTPAKGIGLAIMAGIIMSFFFRFIAGSMATDFNKPEEGRLTPYSAIFFFSLGLFLSNFLFNTIVMKWPISGTPVPAKAYFRGNLKTHLTGILGGAVWCIGLTASILASEKAGFAISYGLGQGATIIAVLWGIIVWKEFRGAPAGTNRLLVLMLAFYVAGLTGIIISRWM